MTREKSGTVGTVDREKLHDENFRYCEEFAKKWAKDKRSHGNGWEDYWGFAWRGYRKAVDRWDPDRYPDFREFAFMTMRSEMKDRIISESEKSVTLTGLVILARRQEDQSDEGLVRAFMEDTRIRKLKDPEGVARSWVPIVRRLINPIDLDRPLPRMEKQSTAKEGIVDYRRDERDVVDARDELEFVRTFMSERDFDRLWLVYGEGKSHAEVCERYGIHRSTVHHLKQNIKVFLRKFLVHEDGVAFARPA